MATVVVGGSGSALGFFIVFLIPLIAGPSSGSSADVATFYVVVLFFVPITVCLLALPIAVIEVIIQHSIERAKKGWVRKEEPF